MKLPLKTQLSVLATAFEAISSDDLERALKGIDLRNDIVHRGSSPADPGREVFLALLKCGRVLLGAEELKTPTLYPGNGLSPPEFRGRQAVVFGNEK
jgi:hypothetical protein